MRDKSGLWARQDQTINDMGEVHETSLHHFDSRPALGIAENNFHGVVELVRRRWISICSIGVIIAVAVGSLGFLLTPRYTAQAFIRIDPSNKSVLDLSSAYGRPPDLAYVDTEVNEVLSRPVAEAVVRKLNLTDEEEFHRPATLTSLILGVDATPSAAELNDDAVDLVLGRLKVSRVGTSYSVEVRYTSTSPKMAALVANSFVEEYVNHRRALQAQDAENQIKTLNTQLDQLGASVRAADAALAKYRGSTGLARNAGSGTVNDQQIASISLQVGAAEGVAAAAMSRANGAKQQAALKGRESVEEVLSSPVITEYRRQRAELVREQARVTSTYGALHPQSLHMAQQLEDIDSQIKQEAERIISGLESAAQTSEAAAANLRNQLQKLRAEQSENLGSSVEADSLERDAQAKRATYDRLAQAVQQMSRDVVAPAAHLSAEATVPRLASFPKKLVFAGMGLGLGVIAGLAFAFIADAFDKSVRLSNYFPDTLGIPFYGSVPLIGPKLLKEADIKTVWDFVKARPSSAYAESLRSIRVALMTGRTEANKGQVICITSALPREGKSTVAVSLARMMAMSGDKVILIDGDTRRSALLALMQRAPAVGLLEVLRDTSQLPRALKTDIARLHLLPQSTQRGSAVEYLDLLSGSRMQILLKVLRSVYRFVIIDAPPLLAVADAYSLAAAADRTLIVARWGKTPRAAIEASWGRLQQSGAKNVAGVFAQVDIEAAARLGEANPHFYYPDVRDYYG